MNPGLPFWFTEKQAVTISTINKAGEWCVKPQASRAGNYIQMSPGRLNKMSDHYASLFFPTPKSTQPSHAVSSLHPPPQELLLVLFTSKPKSNNSVTLQRLPPQYFATCSYAQGTHRTALPTTAHFLHPWGFFWSSFFSQSIFLFLQEVKYGD